MDVYTEKYVPELIPAAQGQVGIVNVKELWRLNQEFWKSKNLALQQEIIFASTGTKKPTDPPDKYVEALAGSDIQTNPPATNDAVEKLNKQYSRKIDQMPPQNVIDDIHKKVDQKKLEDKLMEEGTAKFADPQHALLKLVAQKRASLAGARQASWVFLFIGRVHTTAVAPGRRRRWEAYWTSSLRRSCPGVFRTPPEPASACRRL